MMLKEAFVSVGNKLFRWRSYLPLIMIIIFLPALLEYDYPGNSKKLAQFWDVFCLITCFFGLAIRIFTIGHTSQDTSGRNTKKQHAERLNTKGIYSVVRNPLYLGNFFMTLGVVLFPFSWWLALIYLLSFTLYYERIIFAEESFLQGKFGDEFLLWTRKTPAIIPKFNLYTKSDLPFSLRHVFSREYNGFFAVILIMYLLVISRDAIVENRLELNVAWSFVAGIGFVIWLLLRILNKYTRLLKVSGR